MVIFRNLLVLFFCTLIVCSCGKKDFPELRAKKTNTAEEKSVEKDKKPMTDEGKVIIASIASPKDKKAEIVAAVKEIPQEEGSVIMASAAKESSNDTKVKPILKEKAERKSAYKKKNTTKSILADKQKKKIKSMEASDALVGEKTNEQKTPSTAEDLSITYQIDTFYFDNGSATLKSEYLVKVKEIVKTVKDKDATLYILGFSSSRTNDTDYVTHKMTNFETSLSRAESVADAFIKAGVKEDKVLLEALSDSRPLYLEVMPEGERLNRRVEIYIGY